MAMDAPRPVVVSEYAYPDVFDRLPVLHCEDDGLAEPGKSDAQQRRTHPLTIEPHVSSCLDIRINAFVAFSSRYEW